jgi:glycine cleavage system H protein
MTEFLETTVDKFTLRVATDRLYYPDGLWLSPQQDRRVRIGVTDYLQKDSGDVAFATVKEKGTALKPGDELAELETIKVNVVLSCPIQGMVVEVNAKLADAPEIINQDPYGDGWLATLETTTWERDRAALMNPEAYFGYMKAEVEKELGK